MCQDHQIKIHQYVSLIKLQNFDTVDILQYLFGLNHLKGSYDGSQQCTVSCGGSSVWNTQEMNFIFVDLSVS